MRLAYLIINKPIEIQFSCVAQSHIQSLCRLTVSQTEQEANRKKIGVRKKLKHM